MHRAFPKIIGGGEFIVDDKTLGDPCGRINDVGVSSQRHSFIVMDHGGDTMQKLLLEKNRKLSQKSVSKVAIRLLQILQQIHKQGLVYNNLSLTNILIGDWRNPSIENMKLFDYTRCTKYVDADGKHIR